MKQFEKILSKNSQDIKALENKGQILLEWKRYDQAIAVYEKILELDPGNTTANAKLWTAKGIKEQLNDPNPNDTELVDFVPVIVFVVGGMGIRFLVYFIPRRKSGPNLKLCTTCHHHVKDHGKSYTECRKIIGIFSKRMCSCDHFN